MKARDINEGLDEELNDVSNEKKICEVFNEGMNERIDEELNKVLKPGRNKE